MPKPHHDLLTKAAIISAVVLFVLAIWPRTKPVPVTNRIVTCPATTLDLQIQQADLIVTGTVFAVVPSGQMAEVLIVPTRLYRGTIPIGGINIAATPSGTTLSAVSHGPRLNFQSGQSQYLLFLRSRTDGLFDTSPCWGTRILANGLTTEESGILGAGQSVDEP